MKTRIFTDAERRALQRWLEEGEKGPLLKMTLTRIRRADALALDMRLLAEVLRRMRREGRLVGRTPPSTSPSRAS